MLRVLLSPRMLAFHALVLLVVPSFIMLGQWQFHRWEGKAAAADLAEANLDSAPVPVAELMAPGDDVARADRWKQVTATGRYDTDHELLVRNRDGENGVGLYVLTPLVTADGTGLLVNRGWVPQPPTATSRPDVPPAPTGEVTVTGRAQFSESEANTGIRERGGLPESQIMVIDVGRIAGALDYPVYGGFVELTGQDPESDPAPEMVPVPEVDTGMHLSYAVQWWVFTVVAVVGWVFLVRREIQDAAGGSDSGPDGGSDDGPDGDPSGGAPVSASPVGAAHGSDGGGR
ncbi:SURF1 family cytochrome oxidase biogenesis protein [Murinocardiopsis flavida]|uniref:SURF1 family cytochrome oxidase biogenesis protein n=1 Tax=Murinocardiopsis flavida TaxID=645275 RepID=UPI002481B935|nr:SURF1 family protein [Murinocardiopsis flavida]